MSKCEDLARAALLFHGATQWGEPEKRAWLRLTGSDIATTRVLCDLARGVLNEPRDATSNEVRAMEARDANEWRNIRTRWAQDRHIVRGRTNEPPDDLPPAA